METTVPHRDGKQRVLLTARDYEISRWVAEQGVVSADTVGALAARIGGTSLCDRTRRHLIQRLAAAGLVEARQLLAGQPAVVWPTRDGLGLADLKGRGGQPSLGTLTHQLLISRVRLAYEGTGHSWTSERLLLADGHTGHLPDGLAETPTGVTIAIEVERIQKSAARLTGIVEELATRWSTTHYWVSQASNASVRRAIEGLPEHLRGRVVVADLAVVRP